MSPDRPQYVFPHIAKIIDPPPPPPPPDKVAATLEADTFKCIFMNENDVIFWLEIH